MKRLLPWLLVVFTILVVLGAGGYAGQVWWAKKVAQEWYENSSRYGARRPSPESLAFDFSRRYEGSGSWLKRWRDCSCLGCNNHAFSWSWAPRRSYYETLRLLTGEDLGNDPDAWEAWFKAHPNLVWDAKQKRLVEPKP